MIISTHSPARGLTSLTNMIPRTPIYFNSQPRKGADRAGALLNSITVISTHSPARGLTTRTTSATGHTCHFNSQPRKGADQIRQATKRKKMHFNSQPRKGADEYFCKLRNAIAISTHSPARGLTGSMGIIGIFIDLFQLTAPQGG